MRSRGCHCVAATQLYPEKQGQPGWYCIAVEFDEPRQLNQVEERIVNEFRFGPH